MFSETKTIWRHLQQAKKPIVLYGMGNGAEKILAVMNKYALSPAAFMASDDFVRGHTFLGFQVMRLSEIAQMYDDFIILICFGTNRPEVLTRIYEIAEQYEVYAPDVPVYGEGHVDEEYIATHIEDISAVRELFADEQSKTVYDGLWDFRISGKISILKTITSPPEEAETLIALQGNDKETYVDLGAYNGDTIAQFLAKTDKVFHKIFAVEPDFKNYNKLLHRFYGFGHEKLIPIHAAAWSEDTTLYFSARGGRHSSVSKGKHARQIAARSVDSICAAEKPTLIKMDVEGSEREALIGAQNTIRKHHPRLVISLYHRLEDLLILPKLVTKIGDERYQLHLRQHQHIPAWDTNLYCIEK